jgi:hypothetical protein
MICLQVNLKTKMSVFGKEDTQFYEVHNIVVQHIGVIPIAKGDFHKLPSKAQKFIAKWVCTKFYCNIIYFETNFKLFLFNLKKKDLFAYCMLRFY